MFLQILEILVKRAPFELVILMLLLSFEVARRENSLSPNSRATSGSASRSLEDGGNRGAVVLAFCLYSPPSASFHPAHLVLIHLLSAQ